MNNILEVKFGQKDSITSRNLYQHDYGQKLKFVDLDLPSSYEVHFANQLFGKSITQIGNADGVNIPDILLETADKNIFAWVYLHSTSSDGETVYQVTIPVKRRAKPSTDSPTPVQQDAISEAIAALNYAVSQTTEDVITVQSATDLVEALTTSAAGYVGETLEYRNAAEEYAAAASSVLVVSVANRQRSEEVLADVIALYSGAAAYANTASVYAADAEHTAAQVVVSVAEASNYAAIASQNATLANNYKLQASTHASEAAAASDSAVYAAAQARNAQVAVENMTVSATTLPAGSSATVQKTTEYGVVNLDFGIPKGDKGDGGADGNTLNASIIVKQDGVNYRLYPSIGSNDNLYFAAFCGWWPKTDTMRMYLYFHFQIPHAEFERIKASSGKIKERLIRGNAEEGWDLPPEDLNENNATSVQDWFELSSVPTNRIRQPMNLTEANGYTRYVRMQFGVFNADDELEYSFYSIVCEIKRQDDVYTCVRHYDSKQQNNCIYDLFYSREMINSYQPALFPPPYELSYDLYNSPGTGDEYTQYGMCHIIAASAIGAKMQFRIVALVGANHYIWSSGVAVPPSYSDLADKPQIGGVTLAGNKSLADLGIAAAADIPLAYTSNPAALGTASSGSSDLWARGDHVHENNIFWATYGTTTSAQIEAAYQAGKVVICDYNNQIYLLSVRTNATSHRFMGIQSGALPSLNVTNNTWAASNRTVPLLTSATPQPLGTASAGSGTECARSNHVHAMPSASDVGAVAVAQGVAHSGEFLVVGSDGNVTTVTLATWQGGSY